MAGIVLLAALPAAAGPPSSPEGPWPYTGARVRAERSGRIPTQPGLRLAISADAGNVYIFTDGGLEVRYRMRVEALVSDPAAAKLLDKYSLKTRATDAGVQLTGEMPKHDDVDRVWVSYEVHVPRRYHLDVYTRIGDIIAQDLDGRMFLRTDGGNIRVGRVGGDGRGAVPPTLRGELAARLATGGGHILAGNVAGGVRADTMGGHVTVGDVAGDAVLQSGGGHIHVGHVSGTAQLMTGGGNIVAERAVSGLVAKTIGGRIELGEAAGAIRAQTGGGGIRIARIAGPTVLDSSDGGIFVAGVEAPLRASTAAGTITAWFSPMFGSDSEPVRGRASHGPASSGNGRSELASSRGDIIVYLPREMAVTIDALVEGGSGHRIVADPALPMKVSYEESDGGRTMRGQCALNGGGRVLFLKTAAGNIQLRFIDSADERRLAQREMERVGRRVEAQKALLLEVEQQIANALAAETQGPGPAEAMRAPHTAAAGIAPGGAAGGDQPSGPLSEFARALETFWFGGVRVDPQEQQKRLIQSVIPRYPDLARQAGIEGDVTLRVVVARDGTVSEVRMLSGSPVLSRAAMEAVQQWQYRPALINGRPTSVVTTVTVAFRFQR